MKFWTKLRFNMSKHDEQICLRDMLDHAGEAVELLQLALTRLLEIIGEAAKRVSTNTKQINADIPWSQIIGMRNRLIHGYDIIDYDLLWDTVNFDLPPLILSLQKILKD